MFCAVLLRSHPYSRPFRRPKAGACLLNSSRSCRWQREFTSRSRWKATSGARRSLNLHRQLQGTYALATASYMSQRTYVAFVKLPSRLTREHYACILLNSCTHKVAAHKNSGGWRPLEAFFDPSVSYRTLELLLPNQKQL